MQLGIPVVAGTCLFTEQAGEFEGSAPRTIARLAKKLKQVQFHGMDGSHELLIKKDGEPWKDRENATLVNNRCRGC